MPSYPQGLPCALREGYGFKPTNNILRTPMQSGRARQRIEFYNVPTFTDINWIMNEPQARLFESWAAGVVGAGWFDIPLRTPNGPMEIKAVRFTEVPEGPILIGLSSWQFRSNVEIRDRELIDPDWALILPDYILEADIFDYAMNQEWPLNQWQIYAEAFDTAINEDWPQP